MTVWLELLVFGETPVPLPAGLGADGPAAGVRVERLSTPPRPGADTHLCGGQDVAEQTRWLEGAEHAVRLRWLRDDDDLLAAQRSAVDALEQVAALAAVAALVGEAGGRLLVLDVFCLDARPIAQAIERLRRDDPESRYWVGLRAAAQSNPSQPERLDVETFGLRKLGRPEIHVLGVPRDRVAAVTRFLAKLVDYLVVTGARLQPGDRASFGWVDVALEAAEGRAGYPAEAHAAAPRFVREAVGAEMLPRLPGVLLVVEPRDDSDEPEWVLGANRAAGLVEQLLSAAAQCGLSQGAEVPRRQQTAVVCQRVCDGPPVEARRTEPDEPSASGWVVVCADPEHDHEEAESFAVVSLQQLATWVPQLFSLLAVPVGSGLRVGADETLTILLPADGQVPLK